MEPSSSPRDGARPAQLPSLSPLPCYQVPRLSWGALGGEGVGVLVAVRPCTLVYRGFLARPCGGSRVVVYKEPRATSDSASAALHHEARVLQTLRDVQGVPRLYGLTHPPREALVMSFCPGEPLENFLRADSGRTYLGALRKVCLVLKAVHEAKVVHTNLHQRNILVQASQGDVEHVLVSVLGLRGANTGVQDGWEAWCDLHSVVMLARLIRPHFDRHSPMYARCEEFEALSRLNPRHLDWMVILVAFCRALHRQRAALCRLCAREVWVHFPVSSSSEKRGSGTWS
uniref:Protein kinase domain-containing protein n=1 Tax=Scylla olivacea TaxID=85551 RepID=A0A0P4WNN9_SCYOL